MYTHIHTPHTQSNMFVLISMTIPIYTFIVQFTSILIEDPAVIIPWALYPFVLVQMSKKFCVLMCDVVIHFKVAFHTTFSSVFDFFNFWITVSEFNNYWANIYLFPGIRCISRISLGCIVTPAVCFMMAMKSEHKSSCAFSFHPMNLMLLVFFKVLHILVCLSEYCHG